MPGIDPLEAAKAGGVSNAPAEDAPAFAPEPASTGPVDVSVFDSMTMQEIARWARSQTPPIAMTTRLLKGSRAKFVAFITRELELRAAAGITGDDGNPDPILVGRPKVPPAPLVIAEETGPVPDETYVVLREVKVSIGGGSTRLRPGKLLQRRLYAPSHWRQIETALRGGGMRRES